MREHSHQRLHACSLSEEAYSDDEDTSWKVRRAATKTLAAIIAAYPNLLQVGGIVRSLVPVILLNQVSDDFIDDCVEDEEG